MRNRRGWEEEGVSVCTFLRTPRFISLFRERSRSRATDEAEDWPGACDAGDADVFVVKAASTCTSRNGSSISL